MIFGSIKRKMYCIFVVYTLAFTFFTSCGKSSLANVSLNEEKNEKKDDKHKKDAVLQNVKNIVVASGKAKEYLIEIVLKNGHYDDSGLSPYQNTYEGEFEIRVMKDSQICSTLHFTYGDSKEGLNLPKGGKIQVSDYNGDGQMDFAVGQKISSSAKDYQFFTIDENGMLYRLKEGFIADEEYFPLFHIKNGKVQYRQYNQEMGKYQKKYIKIQQISSK